MLPSHSALLLEQEHLSSTIAEIRTTAQKILDGIPIENEIILKRLIQQELDQLLQEPYFAKIEIQKFSDQSIHPFYFGKFCLPLPNFPVYGAHEDKFKFLRMQLIGHKVEMGDLRGEIFSKRVFTISNERIQTISDNKVII
jgi:hypothetical protein